MYGSSQLSLENLNAHVKKKTAQLQKQNTYVKSKTLASNNKTLASKAKLSHGLKKNCRVKGKKLTSKAITGVKRKSKQF